jgi:hypothetical protein
MLMVKTFMDLLNIIIAVADPNATKHTNLNFPTIKRRGSCMASYAAYALLQSGEPHQIPPRHPPMHGPLPSTTARFSRSRDPCCIPTEL